MEYERAYGGDGYETDAEGNQRSTPMIIEVGRYCIDIDDGMDDSSGSNGSNSSGRDSGDQQRRSAATSQPSSPNNPTSPCEKEKAAYQAAEARVAHKSETVAAAFSRMQTAQHKANNLDLGFVKSEFADMGNYLGFGIPHGEFALLADHLGMFGSGAQWNMADNRLDQSLSLASFSGAIATWYSRGVTLSGVGGKFASGVLRASPFATVASTALSYSIYFSRASDAHTAALSSAIQYEVLSDDIDLANAEANVAAKNLVDCLGRN